MARRSKAAVNRLEAPNRKRKENDERKDQISELKRTVRRMNMASDCRELRSEPRGDNELIERLAEDEEMLADEAGQARAG